MTIDTSKLKITTKSLVGLLTTASALWQIQEVRDFAMLQIHVHPHLASAAAFIGGLWAVLHNPEVEKALNIDSDANEAQPKP